MFDCLSRILDQGSGTMRLKGKQKLQAAVVVLFASVFAYASQSGPEPGYTGAPGDLGVCTACHDTPSEMPNFGPGNVRVEGDVITNGYQPGQQYTLRVTVQQGGRVRFGFQLTALDLNNRVAGVLQSQDTSTQVLAQTGAGGRQYIEHTEQGTTGAGSKTWQIRWTAPSTDVGPVRFYVAGNAADNSGTNQNDFIYTNSALADSPSSIVTLQLQSSPGGQMLESGSTFTINWSVTGADYIDNIELRYSTDDGATFPITNQIFTTTDASVNSYEWTLPNVATERARVRITVGKKSGAEITPIISDRFTIIATGGDPGPSIPEIVNVTVSGKKLIVTGARFKEGATLYMCACPEPVTDGSRVKKVSFSEEPPATTLTAKKAGRDIERGSTVTLQIQNPDGTLSAPFTYTRPLE
jgi:hypothetical protein